MPMTEEELELLTPEERAGLELEDDTSADANDPDDQEDDDQGDDDQDDDGDDQGDDDQNDQGDGSDDQGGDAGASTDTADDQPGRDDGGDPGDQGDDEENPDRPVSPEFTMQAPEGVEDKLKALDTKEDQLNEQFDDGDISAADFRKAIRDVGKERDDITWSVRKYDAAKERHEELVNSARDQYMQNWFKQAGNFVKDHPELSRNRTVMQVFDNIVQSVNTEENIQKLSHQKRLEMAYKQWKEDLGVEVPPQDKQGKQGKPPKKQAPPKKRELPPTLGKVPAADVNETDNGTHGTLNRLFNSNNPNDVAKAEDMLSRMSEADQDRYLRAN